MHIATFDKCSPLDVQLGLAIDEQAPPAMIQTWFMRQMFGDTSFVATSNGSPCAVLVGCIEPKELSRFYVEKVAVLLPQRRLGLARDLMSRAADAAARRGCKQMWLTTDPANAACRAWSRLGFVPDPSMNHLHGWPVYRDLKGPGLDRVVFRKSIQ